MTTPAACPRLFEAEAMRDGRLGGAALASFGRHITMCAACTREVQELEALAEKLRGGPEDNRDGDELHVMRERTRLLAAFDRALVAPGPNGWGVRRRLLWPATAAALVAGLVVFWHVRRAPQPAQVAA